MTHRTNVLVGKNRIVGMCTCGWLGSEQKSIAAARTEAHDHVIDSRQPAEDPKQTKLPLGAK